MNDEDTKLVEHMLEDVERSFTERGRDPHPFIQSLREQWDRSKYVSVAQQEALVKFYENT
jgi:hypothetical protein